MKALRGRLADGRPVEVEFDRDRIASVRELPDAPDLLILPGLVDVQVNGYAGLDVNAESVTVDEVTALVGALWRRGVTTLCPTIISAPEERIVRALKVIADARASDPLIRHAIPGIHVEGPYLSCDDGPRGVHDIRHLRDPDIEEFERWQKACGDLVRIVTLAPERAGSAAYISEVTGRGTIASIGHTAASADQIRAAAQAGARLSTHLGNGTSASLPRHPNHLWAQLADDRLAATFIADGHHLPADTFTAMVRAKGMDHALLVSDAATLAGCPPGDYTTPVGGRVSVAPDGRLFQTDSNLLAGSGRCLTECVAWVCTHTEVSLPAAVRLAATNPSRLLRLPDRGEIAPGKRADLTVTTPDLSVRTTYVKGEAVYET
ncbi:N-acetylglucosamine-6-phosphate deacetylase [Nonomuraea sp. 3N208]|uniref:N-acetylglucosamine-6-phosphate deacetylase n=1 Tax=Nonomuraea sp. 3N208 TaxID=3457421 RepID=UPI003FD2C43F